MTADKPHRRVVDECPNAQYCSAHDYNTAELNKQKGYWKIALTLSASFFASLVAFGAWQVNQTQVMRDMVGSLNATVSALVKVSEVKDHNLEERLYRMEMRIQNLSDKHVLNMNDPRGGD